MICLDISKAFDKVWHNGLIYKLRRLHCRVKMGRLIESFLSERKSIVKIDGALSNPVEVEAEVPGYEGSKIIMERTYRQQIKSKP